jgi:hypothetical protein
VDNVFSGLPRGLVAALILAALSGCFFDESRDAATTSLSPSPATATDPATFPAPAPAPAPVQQPAPLPDTTPVPPITQKANELPHIVGAPTEKAVVGQAYIFEPDASDPNGDELTFSISSKPAWASFDEATGRLWGTASQTDIGSHEGIVISVSDGTSAKSLPAFKVTVVAPRKEHYGHYFATRYADTPSDAAMLCEQVGVSGVVWRRTWNQVEPRAGVYDFSSFDAVLQAIAASRNPTCQLWIFVEFKSFMNSHVKNPCPLYLQAQHSALNAAGNGAATCFMWEPRVTQAYVAMMHAAAARYDNNPRVEGIILQESALGFNGVYSQDVADGGTYTAERWRDALVELVGQCGAAFAQSRCMAFLNFIRGGQAYLYDVSAAIQAVPDNRACLSGPDLLPDNKSLYDRESSVYEVLIRHEGCRSNSAQNDSFAVSGCGLACIFQFAVSGTFGDFAEASPRTSGVCVNSYLFWNHRVMRSSTGLDWTDALPVIAAYPYGPGWHDQCVGGGGTP